MKTRHLLPALALAFVMTGAARAELLFVKVQGQLTGLLQDWYNPFTTLDDVALGDYGQVEDFAWSFVSPRDPASGLPTGKRQHRPVTLRLRKSGGVLQLANSMANNENLSSVRVRWFDQDPDTGAYTTSQELYLVNANVSGVSIYTIREPDGLATYADVTMTYQKIGIEDATLGLSFEDDWETPTQ